MNAYQIEQRRSLLWSEAFVALGGRNTQDRDATDRIREEAHRIADQKLAAIEADEENLSAAATRLTTDPGVPAPPHTAPAPAFDIMTWVPPSIADEKAALLAAVSATKDDGWHAAVAVVNGDITSSPVAKAGWGEAIAAANSDHGDDPEQPAAKPAAGNGWGEAVADTNARDH